MPKIVPGHDSNETRKIRQYYFSEEAQDIICDYISDRPTFLSLASTNKAWLVSARRALYEMPLLPLKRTQNIEDDTEEVNEKYELDLKGWNWQRAVALLETLQQNSTLAKYVRSLVHVSSYYLALDKDAGNFRRAGKEVWRMRGRPDNFAWAYSLVKRCPFLREIPLEVWDDQLALLYVDVLSSLRETLEELCVLQFSPVPLSSIQKLLWTPSTSPFPRFRDLTLFLLDLGEMATLSLPSPPTPHFPFELNHLHIVSRSEANTIFDWTSLVKLCPLLPHVLQRLCIITEENEGGTVVPGDWVSRPSINRSLFAPFPQLVHLELVIPGATFSIETLVHLNVDCPLLVDLVMDRITWVNESQTLVLPSDQAKDKVFEEEKLASLLEHGLVGLKEFHAGILPIRTEEELAKCMRVADARDICFKYECGLEEG